MAFHASSRTEEENKKVEPVAEEAPKGLWDPIYALPLGIAFAVPAIHYEWYLVNEETQLLACFCAFAAIVYKQFGGVIKDALEADGKRILKEHNAAEEEIIQILDNFITEMKSQDTIVQDIEDIKALKKQTYEKLNAAGKIKPLYDFKHQMEKLLNIIAAEEANMQEAGKSKMMVEATAAVQAQFATDKKLQKAALTNAIAMLKSGGGGGGAKTAGAAAVGPDPVKASYLQFFAAKKLAAAKVDAKAEALAARQAILTKLNAAAKNEKMFLEFDTATGKPKMVV
jgi:Mitochondrial ATP synthase B chain precursor (ATP-synt_B)